MKRELLITRSIVILLMILLISCNSDNCDDDSDTADSFLAKFKIVSSSDENHLTNTEFDSSLLRLINADFPNSSTEFEIIEFNNEQIIEFGFAVTVRNIIFEYDGENKLQMLLSDRVVSTKNCVTETLAFKATLADGTILCTCAIDDVVIIEFDI